MSGINEIGSERKQPSRDAHRRRILLYAVAVTTVAVRTRIGPAALRSGTGAITHCGRKQRETTSRSAWRNTATRPSSRCPSPEDAV